MVAIGSFPFESKEESYGEPYYTPPDVIDSHYRIHEVHAGICRMRKTRDEVEVAGMRLQKRYQPFEFSELLRNQMAEWPVLEKPGRGDVLG